jgi:prepilin signal peptidase PulO-like enzyme (type II secretory pathway)
MIVLMESLTITTFLALLGLCMGSFAGATVWRLRGRELLADEADYDRLVMETKQGVRLSNESTELLAELENCRSERMRELVRLRPIVRPVHEDHSRCHHQLAWYDLLPLISWMSTRGRCRYCKKTIGWFEPLMEAGTAAIFVASTILWPVSLTSVTSVGIFGLWLISVVMLVILFAYDFKWFLLPDSIMVPLIIVALLIALIRAVTDAHIINSLFDLAAAIVILSGIYWVLWKISRGVWVGYGDIKLGLALALLLGNWQLAFVALFSANLIGCLLVLPGMAMGKITRLTRVPFGPLLITGGLVALLSGQMIINWYMQIML